MRDLTILLNRLLENDKQIIGRATLLLDHYRELFRFVTLELDWNSNKVGDSCIDAGEYDVVVRYSKKYGRHLHIIDVEGRTLILIHWGNFYNDSIGCILTGEYFADIDGDGYTDVARSKNTFKLLMSLINDEDNIKLKITPVIHKK